MQQPVPPPPPPVVPPLIEVADRAVPWNGKDLAVTVLGGGGLGLVLSLVALGPLFLSRVSISGPLQLLIVTAAMYGTLGAFGWWFCIKRNGGTLADAGFRWVGIGPLLLMVPATIGLIIATGLLSYLLSLFAGDVPTAQEQVMPGQSSLPVTDLIWLTIAGAVAAPVVEEFLFRGLLFQFVRSHRALWVAVVVSSLAFAVAHFVPVLIPVLFVFGIAEAFVFHRYGSIYPAIALHALNNGTLFVVLFLTLN